MTKSRNFYDLLGSPRINPNFLLFIIAFLLSLSLLVFGGRHHRVVVNSIGTLDLNIPDTISKSIKAPSQDHSAQMSW